MTQSNTAELTTSEKPVLYLGDGGLSVTILNVDLQEEDVLVKIENSNTAFDGLVLMHRAEAHDGGRRYTFTTQLDGEDYITLFTESGWYGDTLYFQSPNRKTVFEKTALYKSGATDNASDLINEYDLQFKAGKLSLFAEKK